MKLNHLPVLGLLLAGAAPAADFSPNAMGALLEKPLGSSVYRLGLDYRQSDSEADARLIQRQVNLAIGLPASLELGLGLIGIQEASIEHGSKPLSGKAWIKWNAIQSSLLNASATLQYQPGLAASESYYQASQDRTSFGLDMTLMPLSWMNAAVYTNYSRRKDERSGPLALGAENVVGARLRFGLDSFGLFGDGSQRHLTAKDLETEKTRTLFAREWQAGLYAGTESAQLKIFALIPDTHRYFGMNERGYGASLSLTLGSSSAAAVVDRRDEPGDAIKATEESDRAADAVKTKAPVEAEVKILETNELDEFQLLEKKAQDAARHQQETAEEKAERELRESLEAEKKMAAQKLIDEEKAKREAAAAYHQRVQDDQDAYNEYKDDVNEEVNRYTLPDQEDLNWNGLTP